MIAEGIGVDVIISARRASTLTITDPVVLKIMDPTRAQWSAEKSSLVRLVREDKPRAAESCGFRDTS